MTSADRLQQCCRLLTSWYHQNHRDLPWRHDCTPYRILVSEIMLQQTRVDTVLRYYDRFLRELPDFEALARASEDTIMTLWQGLGYYRRVRNLQKAARQVMENHQGIFPDSYDQIRELAGIGEYTAGAVSSIAFNLPFPAVDGNVTRVMSRLAAENKDAAGIRRELLPVYEKTEDRGTLTQALMELGATVCLPGGTPECLLCPWRDCCRAHRLKQELDYPAPQQKTARKIQEMTVFILRCEDRTAFRKRDENAGVLAGMWELPNCPGLLTKTEIQDMFPAGEIIKTGSSRHIFTHLEWKMTTVFIRMTEQLPQYEWKLPDQCPLPTAFRKLLK